MENLHVLAHYDEQAASVKQCGTGWSQPGDEIEAYGPAPSSGAMVRWLVTDQLGTPRMVLDQTGSLANVKRHDYLPFGEELLAPVGGRSSSLGYAGSDGVRQQFTQKERDNETNLDYFINRYYSATQGRFTSPDEPFADQQPGDPQSWNLFTYTRNNPLRYTDPDGRGIFDFISENLQRGFNAVFYGFRVTNAELAVIVENQRAFLISKTAADGFLYVRMGEERMIYRLDPRTMSAFRVIDWFQQFNAPDAQDFPLTQGMIDNAINLAGAAPSSLGPTSADQISNGHAWSKHKEQFPGWNQQKFTQKIQETMDNASGSDVRKLSNGRTAFWNEKEGMVVIRDPSSPHGGTAFRPTNGRSYFDNLQ